MIDIKTIASGSSGNCYRISDGHTHILIECGIQFARIQEALSFKLTDISGCLISHSHLDHCRSTDKILRAGIDCYLSESTRNCIGVSGHRVHVFESKKVFEIGTFKILAFPLQHDVENHGFLVVSKYGEKLVFATDTYYCKYKFAAVNYYMIECNYSAKILEENIKSGAVPAEIRNRIVKSHFELENVKEFFRANDTSKINEIHLIHMSGNNSDPELFKNEIQKITGKPVYIGGVE